MLDTLPSGRRDTALDTALCVFFYHGHRLAQAACYIGGPSAEARVVDLGLRLTQASRMTDDIHRDLTALHRLLALEEVTKADPAEALLSEINLTSPEVEEICILTDLLENLLETIASLPLHMPPASPPLAVHLPAQHAA